MKSLADGLPPEIAKQIHPDWRKNEADYWDVRDQLLGQYQGQWIGFADGNVVASGRRSVTVSHAARRVAKHPFVTCVGRENEPYRIRRTVFAYDANYGDQPLPVISAEFRSQQGVPGVMFDRVIPDTGSDTTVLPWSDCQQLQLDPNDGEPAEILGVAGGSAMSVGFLIWVYLDGNEYESKVYVDFDGRERLLGRDVLNSLEALFRGPANEVVVNP